MEIARIPPLVTLRTLREVVGLTCPQLAERMAENGQPYHPDSIHNYETGRKGASDPKRVALAHAYGIRPIDVWHQERVIAAVEQAIARQSVT